MLGKIKSLFVSEKYDIGIFSFQFSTLRSVTDDILCAFDFKFQEGFDIFLDRNPPDVEHLWALASEMHDIARAK